MKCLRSAVPFQNVSPDVLMMEPAKDGNRCDAFDFLLRPKFGIILVNLVIDLIYTL
jgi:hypothetical protein